MLQIIIVTYSTTIVVEYLSSISKKILFLQYQALLMAQVREQLLELRTPRVIIYLNFSAWIMFGERNPTG